MECEWWPGMKEKVQQININIVIMKHWAKKKKKSQSLLSKENISFYHNGCECARTEIAKDGGRTGGGDGVGVGFGMWKW